MFASTTHLSDSSTLILDRVDRHHAGVYQCAADNGVREPVSMDIHLTILCEYKLKLLSVFLQIFVFPHINVINVLHLAPPEITVEKSWVHASEGYDIELACIVHGDVTSDVSVFFLFFKLNYHEHK